ncbi:porin [Cupriavidus basilensis]|uniref:Porin n=1 Tax=Cupriavidus basilensis TaxID=68895 RepID=A0A643FK58_9BURK|nr:porin [Cupriavidus basilensis]QOT80147.1 porin [Cupriavidus basilensis]
MKTPKTVKATWLLALPCLGFGAGACAQGSVSLFGMLDAGVTYVSNQSGKRGVLLDTGVYVPSIFGLRGNEDIGGGSKVFFELASQFSNDNGATIPSNGSLFARQAFVGLGNASWGKISLGNQYDFMTESLLFSGLDGGLLYGGFYNFRNGPFTGLGIPNNPTGATDFDRVGASTRVANSVKYVTPSTGGFTLGALYGFGEIAGSVTSGRTASAGVNYERGPLALGAAVTDARYSAINNGRDGIRNIGVGAHYGFPSVLAHILYTNTRNTFSGAMVNVVQAGANWTLSGGLTLGANYQWMKGNAQLSHNKAQQVTSTLMYALSKRTSVYLEGVYQHAAGDHGAQAWINGLFGPDAASSGSSQAIGRIGMATRF